MKNIRLKDKAYNKYIKTFESHSQLQISEKKRSRDFL